jgi:hypothetical protein
VPAMPNTNTYTSTSTRSGMIERSELMVKAAAWMQARGWKAKLAKKRGREQSLFEHTLIEIDVLLQVMPILADERHYSLSDAERRILLVAVFAHDVGKETDAWQRYVGGDGPYTPHILPELTRQIVPELSVPLGFEGCGEPVQTIMARCAEFHHSKPGRSDGTIIQVMLGADGGEAQAGTDRFLTLAHIVRGIDHFASASNPADAAEAIVEDPALGHHLKVARHEVLVRGVSTTFVHQAAQAAFESRRWKPLLYFSAGTVYAADPNSNPKQPGLDDVRSALKSAIDEAIGRDVRQLMVGSPTGNILPKPELVSFAECKDYLAVAGRKIGTSSFAKKPAAARRRVVSEYWRLKGEAGLPSDADVERETGRISEAQPEMLVFKFFKAIVDPDRISTLRPGGVALAKNSYEEIFGEGSWAALQSTSTLMPAKDMVKTVDYFWSLPGGAMGQAAVRTVAELPSDARLQLLVDLLDRVAQSGFAGRESSRADLSQRMAEAFSGDLLWPAARQDARQEAAAQLDHYSRSKPFAGREATAAAYLCPICNAPFDRGSGKKASADFIDNPQTHTNRGVSHGSFGYIMVCNVCYYERLLLQVLLGSRPAEIITVVPRLNLGPVRGERLVELVRQWVEAAKGQMRGDSGSVELGFSFGLTDQVARNLGDRDPAVLQADELVSLFSYRFTPDTQKRRRREALKRLREEFDDNLDAAKAASNQSFESWDAAVEALIENRVQQQEFRAIRREVFRLYETVHLICQTPNMIFIPLTYAVAAGDDESETSKGLRRLYVALLLSLVFDASVAIHQEGEPVDFRDAAGAAYIPPVPAVRALIGAEWVPMTQAERFLGAIGAASLLTRDTGLPTRSALYQVLAADPPERLARRIEEAAERSLTPRHVILIEELVRFHRASNEEVSR